MTNNQERIYKSLTKEGNAATYNNFILNNIANIETAINKIIDTANTIKNTKAKLKYLKEERYALDNKLAQQFSEEVK